MAQELYLPLTNDGGEQDDQQTIGDGIANIKFRIMSWLATRGRKNATSRRTLRLFATAVSSTSSAILPSPFTNLSTAESGHALQKERLAFLDGLRGLAALFVFVEHFALPYEPGIGFGYGVEGHYSWFQLPIIRLFYSGSPMVAIFFVVSGFALSTAPLKLIHNAAWDELGRTMMSSIFRRGIRLFVPPIVATGVMMIGVQLHFYDTVYDTKPVQYDLRQPKRLPTLLAQLSDWIQFVLTRLIYPEQWLKTYQDSSVYGSQLWTIPIEFWSSLILFLNILALATVRRRVRISTTSLLMLLCMWSMRWDLGLFLCGMIIAELNTGIHESVFTEHRCRWLKQVGWNLFFVLGLFFASMPDQKGWLMPGYRSLATWVPQKRIWHSVGAVLIVWSTSRSQIMQTFFSISALRYLGSISYALYIVHIPILNSYGWAIVPAVWRISGTATTLQREVGVMVGFTLLCPLVIWIADVFWRMVDIPTSKFASYLDPTNNLKGQSLPLHTTHEASHL